MTVRRRFAVYVVGLHLLAAGVMLPLLRHHWIWLLAAQAVLVASLVVGLRLSRRLFRTLTVIQDGGQLLREGDFTTRLRATGEPELDNLVGVYNQMIDHLRDERTRLEEQHHFLAQILEQSPLGIVVLDFDGAIALCNPGARAMLDLVETPRGRDLASIAGPLAQLLSTLGAGETRVLALPDGRRLRCRRGAFQDRGFSRGFFTIEELTEELRQAEKATYEKLIRMMSHEVNNTVGAAGSLLNSCLTYAPLLPDEQGQDLANALHVVISRTGQLGDLMRGFAEVVRLPPPRPRPTDVEALVRRVATLLRAECERRRIAWVWAPGEPPGTIDLDPVQLEQVVLNVAKNALEAIGHDGTLTVRFGRRGPQRFLTIEDTGPGVPPEHQANLFTPFFSTKDAGRGIGLTLVQQVLVHHRFGYSLESPSGGPTRFTISFDRAQPG